MYSFYRNLRGYLQESGIPFTDRLDDDYDVLLVNSWVVPYRTVLRAKKTHPGVKVLHRIDGSARDYGRAPVADRQQALVNTLADMTVFQSEYGRYATTRKFLVIAQDGPVIYNPVDLRRFTPEGERVSLPGKVRVCHVAYSTNKKKGVTALFDLAQAHSSVDFILIGRYESPPDLPNLHLLGYADWEALPKVLRSCDVFLTLSENEACPNVVLEALASGLPILYKQSGGTPELVGECGAPVEHGTFRETLGSILRRRRKLGEAARARAVERFSPDVVFPSYLEAAAEAERRPLPGALQEFVSRFKWALT